MDRQFNPGDLAVIRFGTTFTVPGTNEECYTAHRFNCIIIARMQLRVGLSPDDELTDYVTVLTQEGIIEVPTYGLVTLDHALKDGPDFRRLW